MTKLALSKAPIAMLDDFDSDPDIIMLVDDEQDDGRRPTVTISPDFIVTIHNEEQSDDPHYKDLLRLARRMRVSLKNIRYQLTHLKTPLTAEEERFYRMRFFNVRAIGLMLEYGIPKWQNCRDDEAILSQCAQYDIIPPLDEWQADWLTFTKFCADTQYQRLKIREEIQEKSLRLNHIVALKGMKAKALLAAVFPQSEGIEGERPFVSVDFWNSIVVTKRQNAKITFDGSYVITLRIDYTRIQFHLDYKELDPAIPHIIDGFRRINELIGPFHTALSADSANHGPLHLCTNYTQLYSSAFRPDDPTPVYFLSLSRSLSRSRNQRTIVPPPASLTSCVLLAQINAIVRDIRLHIDAIK